MDIDLQSKDDFFQQSGVLLTEKPHLPLFYL